MGEDVIAACNLWLNRGTFLNSLNNTLIALIPKEENSELVSDYKPISSCNVIYKIVKVLTNRLKSMLSKIISNTQSVFILGRLIKDNILIAFEMMHQIKKPSTIRVGKCVMKIDINKAYDKVS